MFEKTQHDSRPAVDQQQKQRNPTIATLQIVHYKIRKRLRGEKYKCC